MTNVPAIELRQGYRISRMIKGGWQLSGDHGEVRAEQAIQDMVKFVDSGVTAFDCADIYTGVEEMIGRFRSELARQRGEDALAGIKIHTKFVPDRDSLSQMDLEDVEAIIDRSLKRLRQDRLDLVQFHWWDYSIPGHIETVQHLDRLREKGKIDLIGVTNFDAEHLAELAAATDIASAQVQYSLLDTRASGTFAETARGSNTTLLCYGSLAGGFLTDAWLGKPDPGYDFENRSLVKYRLIIDEFGGWPLFQELLESLRRVANTHDVDIATIALRTALDCPDVGAAIVGARYADRLPRTLRAFDLELTDADRADMDQVLSRRQGPDGPVYALERDTTGRHGRIMKYNLNKGDQSQFHEALPGAEFDE